MLTRKSDPFETDVKPSERPTGRKLLVQKLPVERVTKGGIILTEQTVDDASGRSSVGKVLGMGPDAFHSCEAVGTFSRDWCQVGDVIRWPYLAAVPFQKDGVDFAYVNDVDVISIVEDVSHLL